MTKENIAELEKMVEHARWEVVRKQQELSVARGNLNDAQESSRNAQLLLDQAKSRALRNGTIGLHDLRAPFKDSAEVIHTEQPS